MSVEQWQQELKGLLAECEELLRVPQGGTMVIGCSTSEIAGERIGTAGTLETAEMLFNEFNQHAQKNGIHLAFQCCEHLNRALVVERETAQKQGWEQVTVIPVRKAGGSMAATAYDKMTDPVVVEFITADGGIDIGDTFIGMHLKHVAVPVRPQQKSVGNAHVTAATTRPKLIGGVRAVYERNKVNDKCT